MADLIDRICEQWSRERPDLDSSGFEIAGRLQVIGKRLGLRVEQALAPLGLKPWAFDVLATLRRNAHVDDMTPTELSRATMLSSGAMTNRLDRLEKAGLIRRKPDPDDRRGSRIALTSKGSKLADRGIHARFDDAADVANQLSLTEQKRLVGLLRKILVQLDGDSYTSHPQQSED